MILGVLGVHAYVMDMLEGSPETGHVLIFSLETEMKNASAMMNKHKIVNSTVLVSYFITMHQ